MKRVTLGLLVMVLIFSMFSHGLGENKNTEIIKILMSMTEDERAAFAEDYVNFMNMIGEGEALKCEDNKTPLTEEKERLQGEGFASAEEAMIACLEALDAGDYARAVRCYAIESVADSVTEDVILNGKGLEGISYSGSHINVFLHSASYREWNISNRYAYVVSNVMTTAYSLAEKMDDMLAENENPVWNINHLYNRMFPEKACETMIEALKLFENVEYDLEDFRADEISFSDTEEWRHHKESFMKKYEAEDVKALSVRFTGADAVNLIFIQYAVKYENTWYLFGTDRFLVGTSFTSNGGIYLEEEIDSIL